MLNYGRCTTANPQTRVGQVSGWQGRTAKVCVAADPACFIQPMMQVKTRRLCSKVQELHMARAGALDFHLAHDAAENAPPLDEISCIWIRLRLQTFILPVMPMKLRHLCMQ
eukprot:scaffold129232_cov17-Tisochrysis_lutea.AAC.3